MEGALCLSGEVGSGKACCVTELCILARQHAARVEQTTPDQHICFSLTPTGQLLPPCAEIEICKRPDGSDWELGSGGFGKVGSAANVSQNCFCDLQRPRCGCDSGHSRTSAARSAALCETVMMSPPWPPTRMQVYKALRHGAQPVAVKVLAVSFGRLCKNRQQACT